MIYFAMGWFSKPQMELYDRLTIIFEHYGADVFFPRDMGINLMEKPENERQRWMRYIFALDTGMIINTSKTNDFIFAVIDDYDVGVVWETGFAFGISMGKIPIVTYSDKGYGLNVMMRMSTCAHIHGQTRLDVFLQRLYLNGESLAELSKDFQDFDAKVW